MRFDRLCKRSPPAVDRNAESFIVTSASQIAAKDERVYSGRIGIELGDERIETAAKAGLKRIFRREIRRRPKAGDVSDSIAA